MLRWIARPWSETDIEITTAGSEQEQVDRGQFAQTATRGRWDQGNSGAVFGADACADSGAPSKQEELKKARTEKKPWDPPFRRQLPRTELARKSLGGRLHTVTDAPLPRKTGRDMEARGVAVRLFPPDSVPEEEDVEGCSQRSSVPPPTPREPLYRRPPPKSQLRSHDTEHGVTPQRHHHSKPSSTRSASQQQTNAESLPSPLDGAQMHHTRHHDTPQSTPPVKAKEYHSVAWKHPDSGHSTPQPQGVPVVTLEDASKVAAQCAPKAAAKGSSKASKQGLPL
ncbi:hypothetical protein EKO04_008259 [Ascochyta lentis]|uniref:Uncharacterized protein n=1 Tax=Ascochyta lentis TaxID=205686 RepID=A0A8H7J260_9PLEO|nr:hypothetical protein EKO04_008259 [Ascochyta lentis]